MSKWVCYLKSLDPTHGYRLASNGDLELPISLSFKTIDLNFGT